MVYICQQQFPNSSFSTPLPPVFPPWYPCLFSILCSMNKKPLKFPTPHRDPQLYTSKADPNGTRPGFRFSPRCCSFTALLISATQRHPTLTQAGTLKLLDTSSRLPSPCTFTGLSCTLYSTANTSHSHSCSLPAALRLAILTNTLAISSQLLSYFSFPSLHIHCCP